MDTEHFFRGIATKPTPDAVRGALDALLADVKLRVSERNRRFLAFVVLETLAGRAERIKAYSIAVDVFGRGDDFDASTDPIVRIEATRLRTALAGYYQEAGARAPIRITMPPGSYVPVFEEGDASLLTPTESPPFTSRPWPSSRPTIVIIHQSEPEDRCGRKRGEMLIEAIIPRLAIADYRVFAMPSPERRAANRAVNDLLANPHSTFALDIAVRQLSQGRRYAWCLTDVTTGEIKVSECADEADDSEARAEVIDMLAERAARAIRTAIG